MRIFDFEKVLRLEHPLARVFEFFSDAFNLEKITPPWLQFHVLTAPPIQMHEGTQIDYRLRIHGIPVRSTEKTRLSIQKITSTRSYKTQL